MKIEPTDTSLADIVPKLAIEMWKLLRAYERVLVELPEDKAPKRAAQYRYSSGRLEALLQNAQLKMLTFEGQKFTANLPVSPLNADEMADMGDLVIESTVEPTIIGENVILHVGKVILKGDENVSRN
jgi:hypothetical protein